MPDVRMRGFQDRTDVTDVLALIEARSHTLDAETVSIGEAAGRVLAQEVVADTAVPGFDRAAMDGYALRGTETFGATPYNRLEFRLIGEALPARPFSGEVRPGEAVRIMTGAPVPMGADAVLQAEAAEELSDRVLVSDPVPPGRHVGRRGEDIESGQILFRPGRWLRPQDAGVLASVGLANVQVIRRPAISLLVTGDELLPAGSKPGGFQIVDSNSVMLEALVRRDGGNLASPLRLPDRPDELRRAMLDFTTDLLLVSGGSSVGKEDHAPVLLRELGELSVHGVALRPASPAGVGFLRSRPVFLLPGNPVSCLCAYDLFAGPTIRRLGGRSMGLPYVTRSLPLAYKLVSMVGRVDYVRVRIRDESVEPLTASGASLLTSTTKADGFVLVPRDSEGLAAGQTVVVHVYAPVEESSPWSRNSF